MSTDDPQLRSYIEKERFALDKIRRQFQFAKDYQNLGTEPPVWQTLSSVFRRAGDLVTLNGVTVTDITGNAAVFADLSFEKAVTQVCWTMQSATAKKSRTSVYPFMKKRKMRYLVVEDDGNGIPAADKERIFERGFGKYTGWGLFLVREILAITCMTISETGVPGEGARFEIRIPVEKFRKEGTGPGRPPEVFLLVHPPLHTLKL